jgi:hypothetical protein
LHSGLGCGIEFVSANTPLAATKNRLVAIGVCVIELIVTWTTSTAAIAALASVLAAIWVRFGAPVVAQLWLDQRLDQRSL